MRLQPETIRVTRRPVVANGDRLVSDGLRGEAPRAGSAGVQRRRTKAAPSSVPLPLRSPPAILPRITFTGLLDNLAGRVARKPLGASARHSFAPAAGRACCLAREIIQRAIGAIPANVAPSAVGFELQNFTVALTGPRRSSPDRSYPAWECHRPNSADPRHDATAIQCGASVINSDDASILAHCRRNAAPSVRAALTRT